MSAETSIAPGESLSGVIRATVTATDLAKVLTGAGKWDDLFRATPRSENTGKFLRQIPAEAIIAMIPDTRFSREIMVTATPIRDGMRPAFSIKMPRGEWRLRPQILMAEEFEKNVLIEIKPTKWLRVAVHLMHKLRSSKTVWAEPDLISWEIVSAWECWQTSTMPWKEIAADLAARRGCVSMSSNTLIKKCQRMGLIG